MCLFIIYTSSLNVSYYNKTRLLEKVDIIVRHTRRRRKEKISLSLSLQCIFFGPRRRLTRTKKTFEKRVFGRRYIRSLRFESVFFWCECRKTYLLCYVNARAQRVFPVYVFSLWRIYFLSFFSPSQQKTTREREREVERENCHTHTI